MLLEICTNSYQSAKNAQDSGAHRIELCQELAVGGITPSYGVIKQVITELDITTHVLIRPRSGNFVYSEAEFEIMKQDIEICKKLEVNGIVSGILNENGTIDVVRTNELLELARPMTFTFHRAFDEVVNPYESLEQLIDLGVERVLFSGQKMTAIEGIELLKKTKNISNGRIIIMPGSGINATNAKQFKMEGFKEIHASASMGLPIKTSLFSGEQTVSDVKKIKDILDAL